MVKSNSCSKAMTLWLKNDFWTLSFSGKAPNDVCLFTITPLAGSFGASPFEFFFQKTLILDFEANSAGLSCQKWTFLPRLSSF